MKYFFSSHVDCSVTVVPPKYTFPFFFFFFWKKHQATVNSSSLWLGSSQGQTRTCLSLITLKCSKSKSSSHLHPCREVKRLGHAPVTNGEEAETRRTLPFLAPCLQLASFTGSQRSPKLTCSLACVPLPQGHPDFPCPSVSFSKMFWPAEVAEHL